MHLNGEVEPRDLVELFSILSEVGAPDAKFDASVLTLRTIASKALYCLKKKYRDYDARNRLHELDIYKQRIFDNGIPQDWLLILFN